MVLGFAVNTFIAKAFGPRVLGEYSLVLAVVNILSTLAVFGFEGGLVKYLPIQIRKDDPRLARGLMVTSFLTSLALSTGGAVIMVLLREPLSVAMFDEPELAPVLAAGAFAVGPFALLIIQQTVLRVVHQLGFFVIVHDVGLRLLIIGGLALLSLFDYESATLVMALNASASWAVVAVVFWRLRVHIRPPSGPYAALPEAPEWTPLRAEYLAYCRRITVLTGTHIVGTRICLLVLASFAPVEDVGVFRIATVISILVALVTSAASMVVPTFYSELYTSKRLKELEELLSSSSKYVTVLTLPLTAWLWFFGDQLLEILGETYVQGHTALIILSSGNVIVGMLSGSSHILRICGKEKVVLYDTIGFSLLNLCLSGLLIPNYGIPGAALASAGSLALFYALQCYHGWRYIGVQPLRRSFLQFPLSLGLLCSLGFAVRGLVDGLLGASLMLLPFLLIVGVVGYFFLDDADQALLAIVRKRLGR